MDSQSIQTMKQLINAGARREFIAQGLTLHGISPLLVRYFQGPIITIYPNMLSELPTWVRPVIYTERLLMIVTETHTKIGALATEADALTYLLSILSVGDLNPSWATPYSQLAESVLRRHNIHSSSTRHEANEQDVETCESLYQLRHDLRTTILRFSQMQGMTQALPPLLPPDTPTFQQLADSSLPISDLSDTATCGRAYD